MNTDEYFMRQALMEAERAYSKDEVPVGAVVVCDKKIIARAHNLSQCLTDATAHAEMQAFTSASEYINNKYLNDCCLFVTLEPCVMCAGAAFWTHIKRIVYGASDPKRGYSQFLNNMLHPKTEVVSNVLENECSVLLKKFFNGKRDI